MEIKSINISLKDLADGYVNDNESVDGGVYAYHGNLVVRPKFQREFVYDHDRAQAVVDTALKGFPLNNIYIVDNCDGTYDCLDGQQRTISLCNFLTGEMSVSLPWLFDGKNFNITNLRRKYPALAERLDNYNLDVKLIKGEKDEQLEWFKTINIAGAELTAQELRNANYVSEWLSDAKRYFSKATKGGTCPAERVGGKLTKEDANRQELLEQVISWAANCSQKDGYAICSYMAKHSNDVDASELWQYFNNVVEWVNEIFPDVEDKSMQGVEWGLLYNKYKDEEFDAIAIDEELAELIEIKASKEITAGMAKIYEYLITRDETLLKPRKFDDVQRKALYKRQKGICPNCGEHYEIADMHAHHIKSWALGGKTELDNGIMLCKECHKKEHLTEK